MAHRGCGFGCWCTSLGTEHFLTGVGSRQFREGHFNWVCDSWRRGCCWNVQEVGQRQLEAAENAMKQTVTLTFSDAGVPFQWLRLDEDEIIPHDIHPNKSGMDKVARQVMKDVLGSLAEERGRMHQRANKQK